MSLFGITYKPIRFRCYGKYGHYGLRLVAVAVDVPSCCYDAVKNVQSKNYVKEVKQVKEMKQVKQVKQIKQTK